MHARKSLQFCMNSKSLKINKLPRKSTLAISCISTAQHSHIFCTYILSKCERNLSSNVLPITRIEFQIFHFLPFQIRYSQPANIITFEENDLMMLLQQPKNLKKIIQKVVDAISNFGLNLHHLSLNIVVTPVIIKLMPYPLSRKQQEKYFHQVKLQKICSAGFNINQQELSGIFVSRKCFLIYLFFF